MHIRTVFRTKQSTAVALRKNMVAAITVGSRIILAVVREAVPVKKMGMTSDKCFIASGKNPTADVIGRAKELGIKLNDCGLYLAQWPDTEAPCLNACLKEGIKRIYFEKGSPSLGAIVELKSKKAAVTQVSV